MGRGRSAEALKGLEWGKWGKCPGVVVLRWPEVRLLLAVESAETTVCRLRMVEGHLP